MKTSNPLFKTSKIVALVTACAFLASANFSSLKDLGLPEKFFPSKSKYYTVESVREADKTPGFLVFKLKAPHGDYEEYGLVALRKTMHEAEVLETLDETEHSGSVKDGAVDSVKDTGRGLKKIVTDPGDSAKGVGKATKKLGRSIGGIFRKKEAGEKTTMGEKLMGGTKRKLAKQMGVDVYTRNPYLQQKLHDMAKSQTTGAGAVMVAKMLMPIGMIASLVLTVGSLNNAADQLVNDSSRPELFRLNKQALRADGYDESDIKTLLNHSYYTPREVTYMRFYLDKLKGVEGSVEILKAAGSAKDAIPANKILYESQIIAEAFGGKVEGTKILRMEEGLALKQDNKLIFATAFDYLDKSKTGDSVLQKALALKDELQCNSLEIWNAGKVTLGFSAATLLKGVKTRGLVIFTDKEEAA